MNPPFNPRFLRNSVPLILTVGIGVLLWFLPHPQEISDQGWKVFAIFVATITGIVTRPLPMGAVAVASLGMVSITGVLTMDEALSGYSRNAIWLIVMAFFIARGFVQTGLAVRISYYVVMCFGKTTLGLAYSLGLSELILAPAMPSITARTGAIIYPIINALSNALGSNAGSEESARKLGTFLILSAFQCSVITSAMFLTAMAANPIIVDITKELGVTITWGTWAIAAFVPGMISLIVVPFLIYKISAPEIKHLPNARQFAKEKLAEMGKMKKDEWIMATVFTGLIVLWAGGDILHINATTAALVGVTILLLTKVLTWGELLEEKGAWGTLIWFGALMTLASYLNQFGVVAYFSEIMSKSVSHFSWPVAFAILAAVYFYSHYLFASSMAHVGAMFGAFFSVSTLLGTPPLFAGLVLAFFSSLYGGLTHYGIGSGPVLFGSGYVHTREWWKVGFLVSLVNIAIWVGVGSLWWKFLGYY